MLGRDSGETFQIFFKGPGWVLIQPSEGPRYRLTSMPRKVGPVASDGSPAGG